MQRWTVVFAFVFCLGCLATPLRAQDDPVREAMEATLAAWNEGDFETLTAQFAVDARGFFLDGGILLRGFNRPVFEAAYAAGFRASMTARDPDIRVLGEVALSVAFLDGSLTLPDGSLQQGSWRYSETRVLREGTWQIVQYHFSPLTTQTGR